MRIRLSSILSLLVLLLAGMTGIAQSSKPNACVPTANSPTANLGMIKPGHCALNWDSIYNGDLDQLDSLVNGHATQINTLLQQAGSNATGVYMVSAFPGSDFGAQLNACVFSLNPVYGGTCDARGLVGSAVSMTSSVTISTPNTVINLPCSTISTAQQITVAPGTRNVSIHGCSYRGGANTGSNGGTVWAYTGSGKAFQVGDPSYAQDTKGFHMDNVNLVTVNAGTAATAFAFYRTQEIDLRSVYLNGNQLIGQTGILLDGTGNYSGGTFDSDTLNGFGTGVLMTGHQSGSVSGDFSNASTFTRLHVVCPTSGGSPVSGTYGVNVVAGDGNTWTGGDIESCDTMFHLGANAINNTIVGLRNENSNFQYVADSGSSYNAVFTGGTLYTGRLIDNGIRNSFWDAFHRTVNGMKGDYYSSQQDATVVNHLRLGIGTGNVRGLQWESQVDLGTSSTVYNWLWGLTDGGSGQSNWIYQDLINNVIRLQFQQNNTAGGSNPTAVNAAGTGNVCFNCSSNSGTGGVAFSSGGPTPTTVATVDNAGNAHFNGNHQTDGTSQSGGSNTVRNNADAEVDYFLQAGLTATQKASYTYRDYTGASQWYMVKTQTNDWALNSALGLLDSFKAYQPANGGDTYINAQIPSGVVRLNYETGSGTGVKIYGGNSSTVYAAFTGQTAIQFPGLAATSGNFCLQIDASGYITNTGGRCLVQADISNLFSNSASKFYNGVDGQNYLILQGGLTAEQLVALEFANYLGTSQWEFRKDSSNNIHIRDAVNGKDAIVLYQGGEIDINSQGASAVVINNGSGTGGFLVKNGAGTTEFTVTNSGNTTAVGFLSGKFYIGNSVMTISAGAAAGSSPTVACTASHGCTGAQGSFTVTTGSSPTTGTLLTLGFPNTHTNLADCVGNLFLPGTGQLTNWEATPSTTNVVIKIDGTALTASTAYTFTYWCGGN